MTSPQCWKDTQTRPFSLRGVAKVKTSKAFLIFIEIIYLLLIKGTLLENTKYNIWIFKLLPMKLLKNKHIFKINIASVKKQITNNLQSENPEGIDLHLTFDMLTSSCNEAS